MDGYYFTQIALFTLFTVAGTVGSLINLIHALRMSAWLRFTGLDGSRLIVVRSGLAISTIHMACQCIFLAITAIAVMNPPTGPPAERTLISEFISWGFITAQGLFAWAAAISVWSRSILLRSIDDEELKVEVRSREAALAAHDIGEASGRREGELKGRIDAMAEHRHDTEEARGEQGS